MLLIRGPCFAAHISGLCRLCPRGSRILCIQIKQIVIIATQEAYYKDLLPHQKRGTAAVFFASLETESKPGIQHGYFWMNE